jgi:hypothetical protein
MTKANSDPIFKSEKLTAQFEKRDKLKANSAQCLAEKWRLTKLSSPQVHDVTVIRVVDDGPPSKTAHIGFKNSPRKPGVISTGVNEQNEAALKEGILKLTLAGETLPETTSVKEQLEKLDRQYAAYEDAIEFVNSEIETEKTAIAIQYSKQQKTKHDEIMRRLFKTLVDVHEVHSEWYSLKRHLIDTGVKLRGLCLTSPEEFLDTPLNKWSKVGDFFREGQRQGYIKEIPVEYRT